MERQRLILGLFAFGWHGWHALSLRRACFLRDSPRPSQSRKAAERATLKLNFDKALVSLGNQYVTPTVKTFEAEGILPELVEAAGLLLFALESPPKFLLMRHRNRWDLPKGHAELGEEILTTALRETEEETGVPASAISVDPDFRFVVEYSVTYRNRGERLKRVTYFLGYLPAVRQIVITEHESYLWCEWPQTESLQPQTIDPLLKAARDHFAKFPQRITC